MAIIERNGHFGLGCEPENDAVVTIDAGQGTALKIKGNGSISGDKPYRLYDDKGNVILEGNYSEEDESSVISSPTDILVQTVEDKWIVLSALLGQINLVGNQINIQCTGDNRGIFVWVDKEGATQVAAGAAARELWRTKNHATLPDNVLMVGI